MPCKQDETIRRTRITSKCCGSQRAGGWGGLGGALLVGDRAQACGPGLEEGKDLGTCRNVA